MQQQQYNTQQYVQIQNKKKKIVLSFNILQKLCDLRKKDCETF